VILRSKLLAAVAVAAAGHGLVQPAVVAAVVVSAIYISAPSHKHQVLEFHWWREQEALPAMALLRKELLQERMAEMDLLPQYSFHPASHTRLLEEVEALQEMAMSEELAVQDLRIHNILSPSRLLTLVLASVADQKIAEMAELEALLVMRLMPLPVIPDGPQLRMDF
jgi:hypothetical protein